MCRLFDDYGVNLGRIGANPNESLVGGAPIETEISEYRKTILLGDMPRWNSTILPSSSNRIGRSLSLLNPATSTTCSTGIPWGRLEKSGIGFSILEAERRARFIVTERNGLHRKRALPRWVGHEDKLD
jgi:hypothetical protein